MKIRIEIEAKDDADLRERLAFLSTHANTVEHLTPGDIDKYIDCSGGERSLIGTIQIIEDETGLEDDNAV